MEASEVLGILEWLQDYICPYGKDCEEKERREKCKKKGGNDETVGRNVSNKRPRT